MRNAEEFSARRSGLTRMLPTYRRPGTGAAYGRVGRIRYAHGGALPRVEPFCAVPQGAGRSTMEATGTRADVRDAAADGDTGGRDTGDGDTGRRGLADGVSCRW